MRATTAILAAAALLLPHSATRADPSSAGEFNAAGYRAARYRAPVTRDPAPAARLALPAAMLLHPGKDAQFIDVLPAEGGVRDPTTGAWRLAASHVTIAGALWHPEAGRGSPDPVLWRGLVAAVRKARRRDPSIPVVLFCRSDCWMGWNAAKRLASQGFSGVWWLAEGIDGWHDAGGKLVPAIPARVHE
ncbi:rhodanese [Novosphingobium sp. ZN18A2]|uniref:rhodanese n=1 Tax=Novosphingobium sp. ZN18A2 TaxID=3079861 RepID=UPI0030D6062F